MINHRNNSVKINPASRPNQYWSVRFLKRCTAPKGTMTVTEKRENREEKYPVYTLVRGEVFGVGYTCNYQRQY